MKYVMIATYEDTRRKLRIVAAARGVLMSVLIAEIVSNALDDEIKEVPNVVKKEG